MDTEIQRLLDEGIASLRIGNRDEARHKLMQVINADERNESAWLYLSEAVEGDEDREICLENVLAINPANERAETALKAIRDKSARETLDEEAGLVCHACGATNPAGSQRCLSCYADLSRAAPAEAQTPAELGQTWEMAVGHKSFMEMLDTWGEMFTLPSRARLDEEHTYARWGLVVPGILIAGAITYFFVSLTNVATVSFLPGGSLDLAQLLPITCGGAVGGAFVGLLSFFIGSGLYYLVARLFKGKGEFVVQSYLLSLVYGPFSLVYGIVSPLMLLSAINPVLGVIPALILIPVSILVLIMSVRALRSAHDYGTGAALGTIFLPGIVFACFGGLLAILAGGLGLLTTLPVELP